MPPPRATNAYPVEFRAALNRAISTGSVFIPHANPAALRLKFYGYVSALRRESDSEIADACAFTLSKSPLGLQISLKETTPDALAIRDALGGGVTSTSPESSPLTSPDEIDSLFNRITGDLK